MLPIKTTYDGEQTTKVCVEDVYKVVNRLYDSLNKCYENIDSLLEMQHRIYDDVEGELVVGVGVSKPCGEDTYDKELGDTIAFRKAKLNANIKKARWLTRIYKEVCKLENAVEQELNKNGWNIAYDIKMLRLSNPEYLRDKIPYDL